MTPRQVIELPIVGGIDEGTDPRSVVTLLEARNCVYRKRNGLAKRYGSRLLCARTLAAVNAPRGVTLATLTSSFAQPLVGSTVTVAVDSSSLLVAGDGVWINGGGAYRVHSTPTPTSAVLVNLGEDGAANPVATVGILSTAITKSGVPAAELLRPYGNALVQVAAGRVYSWSSNYGTAGVGRLIYRDTAPVTTVEREGVAFDQTGNEAGGVPGYLEPDVATNGTFTVYVWTWQIAPGSTYTVLASVYDNDAGTWVATKQTVASGIASRVVARVISLGTKFLIAVGASATVNGYTYTPATNTFSTASALTTTNGGGNAWDICLYGSSDFLFAYFASSGANRYTVARFDSSFVQAWSATTAETATNAPTAIAVHSRGASVCLAYSYNSGAARFLKVDGALNGSSSPTFGTAVTIVTSGSAFLTYSHISIRHYAGSTSTDLRAVVAWTVTDTLDGSTATPLTFAFSLLQIAAGSFAALGSTVTGTGVLASHVFQRATSVGLSGTSLYVGLLYNPPSASALVASHRCLYVVELEHDSAGATGVKIDAIAAPRQAGPVRRDGSLSHAPDVSDDETLMAVSVNPASLSIPGVSVLRVRFDSVRTYATANGLAFLSGGSCTEFDGVRDIEIGYAYFPSVLSVSSQSTGGALTLTTAYDYVGVYETKDDKGNVLRSAVSPVLEASALTGSNNKQTILFPELGLGKRKTGVTYVLYRYDTTTEIYYRAAESQTTSVVDTISDAALITKERLYTTGDVLDHVCPPSARLVAAHKNRLWLAGTDDDSIWASKQIVATEVPGFNEGLRIEAFGEERKTALAVLDDKLIVFEPHAIYCLSGDVANDTGDPTTSTYQVDRISSDSGCIETRSVVVTTLGVFFRSERGIMLLDRSLTLRFVGEQVLDSLPSTVTITDATLVASQGQVRFATQSGTTGDELVYDLGKNAWTKFDRWDASAPGNRAVLTACVHQDEYTYASYTGQLSKEDASTYRDASNGTSYFPVMSFSTAWFGEGKQGQIRVRRVGLVGQKYTSVGFALYLYAGHDESTPDTFDFTGPTADANFAVGPFHAKVVPVRQKTNVVRVRFADSEIDATSSRSIEVSGIAVEWASYDTQYKNVPATRRA